MPFVKLDCSMLNSSIWPEKAQRDIFITALLMAEPREFREPQVQIRVDRIEPTGWSVPAGWYGFVAAASVGIIHRAMVDREAGMKALAELGEPDAESKSKAYDGRRLVRVDGGFIALNYVDYRDRDHTAAERQKRWRERQKKKEETKTQVKRVNGMKGKRDGSVLGAPVQKTHHRLAPHGENGNGS